MENENIAVGLDIGTTKIVAMIGRKNEYGKMEILGVGRSCHNASSIRKRRSLLGERDLTFGGYCDDSDLP